MRFDHLNPKGRRPVGASADLVYIVTKTSQRIPPKSTRSAVRQRKGQFYKIPYDGKIKRLQRTAYMGNYLNNENQDIPRDLHEVRQVRQSDSQNPLSQWLYCKW